MSFLYPAFLIGALAIARFAIPGKPANTSPSNTNTKPTATRKSDMAPAAAYCPGRGPVAPAPSFVLSRGALPGLVK